MKAEFLQNFKVGDAPLPKEVVDAILAENDRDVEDLQSQVAKLTRDLSDKEAEHQAKLAELEFDGALKDAITAAGGLPGTAGGLWHPPEHVPQRRPYDNVVAKLLQLSQM